MACRELHALKLSLAMWNFPRPWRLAVAGMNSKTFVLDFPFTHPRTREEPRLPVTRVGGGWWSAAICGMSYWSRRWLALTKWALDKGGATEVVTSWLIMTRATAQAGNRASKTVRRPQWWESGPEQRAVTPGVALAVRLAAYFCKNRACSGIVDPGS